MWYCPYIHAGPVSCSVGELGPNIMGKGVHITKICSIEATMLFINLCGSFV
jgi:hypothetical protein